MKKPIWTQDYAVNSFLVTPQKRLGIYALLNILQDAAWNHATHLGHGYEETLAGKTAWVLTRQKVQMKSWPTWGESVSIRTWVRPLQGPFATRDFEILHKDQIIGTSTTSWILMDVESRAAVLGDLASLPFAPRTDYRLPIDAKKIILNSPLEQRTSFEVRNTDLDMNEHVNNTRYVQWILDSIPREWHRSYVLEEYDVNFLAETHAGDSVDILMSPENPEASESFEVQFQGQRNGKPVFTAQMRVKPV